MKPALLLGFAENYKLHTPDIKTLSAKKQQQKSLLNIIVVYNIQHLIYGYCILQ